MTHAPGALSGLLDTNTLKELARVICGDDHLFYRRAFEIAQFLENAGWRDVPDFDGESRAEWTLDRLLERRTQPSELEKVLLRLADAREYYDEPDQLPKVLTAVNTFLVHEGLRLENPGGRPRLLPCDPALAHPGQHAPVELKATMSDIIGDPRMATLLGRRLDEARTCFANGAHVAAVIMLGSLLEGARPGTGRHTAGQEGRREDQPRRADRHLSRRGLNRRGRDELQPRPARLPQLRPPPPRVPRSPHPRPRHPQRLLVRRERRPQRPRRKQSTPHRLAEHPDDKQGAGDGRTQSQPSSSAGTASLADPLEGRLWPPGVPSPAPRRPPHAPCGVGILVIRRLSCWWHELRRGLGEGTGAGG